MYSISIYEKRIKKIEPKLDRLIKLIEEYHTTRSLTSATEAADLIYDMLINDEVIMEVKL